MKYREWIAPLALLFACTGSYEDATRLDRAPADGSADHVTGHCAPEDCGGASSSGTGWCDRACGLLGDCAAGVTDACGLHECLDDVACEDGAACEPGPPNRCEPVTIASGAE